MQSEFLKIIEANYLKRRGEIADMRPDKGFDTGIVRDIAIITTVLDCLSHPMLANRLSNARQFDERMSAARDRKIV